MIDCLDDELRLGFVFNHDLVMLILMLMLNVMHSLLVMIIGSVACHVVASFHKGDLVFQMMVWMTNDQIVDQLDVIVVHIVGLVMMDMVVFVVIVMGVVVVESMLGRLVVMIMLMGVGVQRMNHNHQDSMALVVVVVIDAIVVVMVILHWCLMFVKTTRQTRVDQRYVDLMVLVIKVNVDWIAFGPNWFEMMIGISLELGSKLVLPTLVVVVVVVGP